jgi:hypothetical protein
MSERSRIAVNAIEIRIESVAQLFHSLDPSPFNEKDLDKDAEEFVPWQGLPRRHPYCSKTGARMIVALGAA